VVAAAGCVAALAPSAGLESMLSRTARTAAAPPNTSVLFARLRNGAVALRSGIVLENDGSTLPPSEPAQTDNVSAVPFFSNRTKCGPGL
jgi:hypothetical protein